MASVNACRNVPLPAGARSPQPFLRLFLRLANAPNLYLQGRDMGFDSINGFNFKISGGGGEWAISRESLRLGTRLDFFRLLMFYHSCIGFYINSWLTTQASPSARARAAHNSILPHSQARRLPCPHTRVPPLTRSRCLPARALSSRPSGTSTRCWCSTWPRRT